MQSVPRDTKKETLTLFCEMGGISLEDRLCLRVKDRGRAFNTKLMANTVREVECGVCRPTLIRARTEALI